MGTPDQKTILLVEDEAVIAVMEKETLKRHGFNVITASNGEKAIEIVQTTPDIDLILMDINLGKGKIDGTEAAELILKERDIPILFLSSYTQPEVVQKTEKITSYGYVVKDSGETVLITSIKMAFKLFEAHRELREKEEALVEESKRRRVLFDQSPDGILIIDPQTAGFLDFNTAAHRQLGYSREEFAQLSIFDVEAGETAELTKTHIAEVIQDGRADFETLQQTRQGEIRNVHVTAQMVDIQGHPVYHCVWRDVTDRKQAEEQLQESEKRFREMANLLPQSFCEINLEGRLTFANKNAFTVFGYTNEELDEGINVAQVLIPEDYERAMVNIHKVLGGEERGGIEYTAVTKGGSTFPVLVYSNPIIKDNKLVGIRTILIDITERKRTDEALRKSEEKYRLIFEHSPLGLFHFDENGVINHCNDNFVKIIGSSQETLIGLNLLNLNDKKMVSAVQNALIGDIGSYEGVYHSVTAVKSTPVRTLYAPIKNEAGHMVGGVGIVEDITARKNAEETIARERQKLKTLSDNAPFGLALIDQEGHFTYINAKFTELFGYELSDIPDGRTWFKKAYPDAKYRQTVISTWVEDFGDARPGERKPRVFTITCKDGTQKITQLITSVLVSGDYLMTCENITELRQLENQLRQAQKMEAIGTLAGGIAHDFNNILTALMGYASLVQMKMNRSDPLRSYVDEVLSASEKAVDLTQSLLAFSRQQSVTLVPLNMNNSIKTAKKLLRRLLTEDIELRTSLTDEEMIVMADKSQMDQILFNLVTNARDAMPRGGALTIATTTAVIDNTFVKVHGFGEPGQYVRISIADTGMGMDEITRSKIFDPFFTTKEVGKGTGLGLATVYGIVKQNNGYIIVESTLNQGSIFHIYLPKVKMKVDEAEDSVIPPGGKETILIAEDNEGVRRFMREVLQKYGYIIREAVDGEDAIKRFKEHPDIDLVIIDSVMPKKNGREAYEEIHGIDPYIKVLFTSGHTKDVVLDKGIIEKELDFIGKPLSINKLLQKVREVLDREHRHHQ